MKAVEVPCRRRGRELQVWWSAGHRCAKVRLAHLVAAAGSRGAKRDARLAHLPP